MNIYRDEKLVPKKTETFADFSEDFWVWDKCTYILRCNNLKKAKRRQLIYEDPSKEITCLDAREQERSSRPHLCRKELLQSIMKGGPEGFTFSLHKGAKNYPENQIFPKFKAALLKMGLTEQERTGRNLVTSVNVNRTAAIYYQCRNSQYYSCILYSMCYTHFMQITLSNFPALLKQVRAQLHLSQTELADELGVSFSTVNRWENQQTKPLRLALRQFEMFCEQKMADGALSLKDLNR